MYASEVKTCRVSIWFPEKKCFLIRFFLFFFFFFFVLLSDPLQKCELLFVPDGSQICHRPPRVRGRLAGDVKSAGVQADGFRVRSVVCSTDEFLRGLCGTWQ